ncbi:hypothetical protein SCHIN_v1c05120 [Spiroplasma chinense]|uniref:Uncharacterized protein n=1 Tax=Spiroplasma chinense TaxID=216932 RepID=A0A5B9Y4U3_9MOLU|nr:hypothetical protein [Spiroplasma chinense]QEH61709.1 hypothetical protein SCHIN_v1c05120 [Spiroplasma chinense]
MLYTASDAIDLVYRIIGKTSSLSISKGKLSNDKCRLIAQDIKEFYRELFKRRIKHENEIEAYFNEYQWSFVSSDDDQNILLEVKEFIKNNFLISEKSDYFLSEEHVHEELNKIYDKALDNSFVVDKESINWNKTVKLIESRFLTWVQNKSLKQNSELKARLLTILDSMNEKEEVNYHQKSELLVQTMDKLQKFVSEYELGRVEKVNENSEKYERYLYTLKTFESVPSGFNLETYISFEKIYTQVRILPDDASMWEIDFTMDLLIRVFFATLVNSLVTSGTFSIWNAKIEMIRSNGGWKIDKNKEIVRNMYIALTQDDDKKRELIKFSGKKLNRDLIDIAKKLVKLVLELETVEKFSSIEKKETFDVPNVDVISVYFVQLANLIKYHEAGISDSFLAHPGEVVGNFDIAIADALLDFNNVNNVLTAVKKADNKIADFPDEVCLRTIHYIEKLGEITDF